MAWCNRRADYERKEYAGCVAWGGGGGEGVFCCCSLASVGGKHEIELVTPVCFRSFMSTLVQEIIIPPALPSEMKTHTHTHTHARTQARTHARTHTECVNR